jgi:hypothetical protein
VGAEVPTKRLTRDVLDEPAERRESVVRVLEDGSRLGCHRQATRVVVRERRQRLAERDAVLGRTTPDRAPARMQQIAEVDDLRNPGRVGE